MSATLYDVTAGVATITLNRPDNRNALSNELVEGLAGDLKRAIDDAGVHLIVLTATGNTFCAGADLKERRTATAADGELPKFVRVFQQIQAAPKPVVGRINGHALAGGLGLAACCDISIAAESATLGFTEVRIGVTPAIISVVCLPKMRTADATWLFLTGERIGAARAAEVGLINRAVPDAELDAAVADVVAKLRLGGPIALGKAKELLARVPAFSDQTDAFRWTAEMSAALFASEEGVEGMTAFAQRRPPSWV